MRFFRSLFPLALVVACTAPAHDPASPDGGALDDAPEADAAPPPLSGPLNQWTWFDVPGAVCGDGSPTGIGVNFGTSDELVVYLEGGGLCWDEPSCQIDVGGIHLASFFVNGYHRDTFGAGPSTGMFDKALATNPYKDATLVYVPYCTGDLHTGSTTGYFPLTRKTGHFAGGQNLALELDLLKASLPNLARVTLTGSSAGGYGAVLNFDRVAQAFAPTRVDLVSDSAPLWNSPLFTNGYNTWNTRAILPVDCDHCLGDNPYPRLYSYLSAKYPASRFAFLSHDQDLVISAGFLELPPYPFFYFSMKAFTLGGLGPLPNWRYFVAAGTAHTTVYDLSGTSLEAHLRVTLDVWLGQMASDDPSWRSATTITQ
ncbi:MAG: pectin acetylesterase-family hydrolase [Kofleriaceae bacterium]